MVVYKLACLYVVFGFALVGWLGVFCGFDCLVLMFMGLFVDV